MTTYQFEAWEASQSDLDLIQGPSEDEMEQFMDQVRQDESRRDLAPLRGWLEAVARDLEQLGSDAPRETVQCEVALQAKSIREAIGRYLS